MTGRPPDQRSAARPARSDGRKTCVICGKPRDPRYAPFCSKRCADVDLGRWLKGPYVIPGGAAKGPQGDDET